MGGPQKVYQAKRKINTGKVKETRNKKKEVGQKKGKEIEKGQGQRRIMRGKEKGVGSIVGKGTMTGKGIVKKNIDLMIDPLIDLGMFIMMNAMRNI